MGNPADIERAKLGKEVWNEWAEQNEGVEVDFSCEGLNLHFSGFVFPGRADFRHSHFSGGGRFDETQFRGHVRFDDAKFEGVSFFDDADFNDSAWFDGATFTRDAHFRAIFRGHAKFKCTVFNGSVWFRDAEFIQSASEPCFSIQRNEQIRRQEVVPVLPTKESKPHTPKSTNSTAECNGHLKLGMPGDSDQLLCRLGYAIGYDYEKKSAVWVAYRLTHQIHSSGNVPRQNNFRADSELPANHRKTLRDFEEPVFERYFDGE